MRLFDRVASGHDVYTARGEKLPADRLAKVRRVAHQGVRVIADEAAQHFWQSGQAVWNVEGQDFGPLRAPFDLLWIEWLTPTMVLDGDGWKHTNNNAIAMLVQNESDSIDGDGMVVQGLFFDNGIRQVVSMPIASAIVTDKAGVVVGHDFYCDTPLIDETSASQGLEPTTYSTSLYQLLYPGLLTIGWMNCKNISLVDDRPDERVARKRERKGQFAGLSYQRIVIDGVAAHATRSNREAEAAGKRLHMVRGHFATYTDERPLFGRVTGTFWRAWHVRGDAARGRINHEYHVQGRPA